MSNTLVSPQHRTVRFWACGGTGIDLLRDYRATSALNTSGLHAIELDTYIDTSDANMHELSRENVYRLDGIDGGGKDREKVKAAVIPVLPEILMEHKPGDLNIVLFGLSGGTGSAVGPFVLGHLLKNGHAAMGIVLADHTSSKSTANAISSLTDLESISQQLDKAVVLHYYKNDPTKSLLDNDALSKFVMSTLSILGSGLNLRLDSADINNFIQYPTVTHHKAGLAQLHVTTDVTTWEGELKYVASYAALLRDELTVGPTFEMDYDTVGYFPQVASGYDRDLYYAVTPGMNGIVNELLEARAAIEMRQKVKVQSATLGGGDGGSFGGNTGISII